MNIDGSTAVIRAEGRLTVVGRTVLELTSLDRVLRPAVSVHGAFGGARPEFARLAGHPERRAGVDGGGGRTVGRHPAPGR